METTANVLPKEVRKVLTGNQFKTPVNDSIFSNHVLNSQSKRHSVVYILSTVNDLTEYTVKLEEAGYQVITRYENELVVYK